MRLTTLPKTTNPTKHYNPIHQHHVHRQPLHERLPRLETSFAKRTSRFTKLLSYRRPGNPLQSKHAISSMHILLAEPTIPLAANHIQIALGEHTASITVAVAAKLILLRFTLAASSKQSTVSVGLQSHGCSRLYSPRIPRYRDIVPDGHKDA